MMEMLRPSLLYSQSCKTRRDALIFIGYRINASSSHRTAADAMQSAEDTLRSYLLPHVGTAESESDKKIFFIGYMVSNDMIKGKSMR